MRTRFAPAPTGWLHLGHVLNAEYVWSSGADVVIRIEDHDRERCRPEYERAILDDLDWLGFAPDVYPTIFPFTHVVSTSSTGPSESVARCAACCTFRRNDVRYHTMPS